MKKAINLLLICVLLFSVFSCNDNEKTLTVDKSEVKFNYKGGMQTIKLSISDGYSIALSKPEDNWVKVTNSGNFITVTTENYVANEPRENTIRVAYGNQTKEIIVTQTGIDYSFFLGEYTMSYENDQLTKTSMNVSLETKVEGESYLLKGDKFTYDFEVRYMANDHNIRIYPQYMETETIKDHFLLEDGDYNVWIALWGLVDMTSPTNSKDASIIGEYTENSIVFKDGGGWNEGELSCICVSYFQDDIYKFDKYSNELEATYMNMSLTKK